MTAHEIAAWLKDEVAKHLDIGPDQIDPHRPFDALGLDSQSAVEITDAIERRLARPIDPVLLYNHPTIDAASRYLAGDQEDGTGRAADEERSSISLAIVGMACRFPGAADLRAFWRMLMAGQSSIGKMSDARWRLAPGQPGADVISSVGSVGEIDAFAGEFFGIRGDEARRMDPQQRFLIEVAWEAIQDAGIGTADIRSLRCSVHVGISTNEYGTRQTATPDAVGAYTGTGNALSIAANRLSYLFDLRGESMAVDTACSSSLVALHLAVQALRRGSADAALVGGVNLLVDPELSFGMLKAGMLSPDGRCATFDRAANGYVRGEGCGVIVLKRLPEQLVRTVVVTPRSVEIPACT